MKKCHADDLVHGITVQLLEYMRRMSADYGIYCILYFGEDYLPSKNQFPNLNPNQVVNIFTLPRILESYTAQTNSLKISVVVLDVSHAETPSKKGKKKRKEDKDLSKKT